MQVPTFHIGLFANTSFLHFQFGPDGYSRFWHTVAILGHFFLRLNIRRERREGEVERGGHALLRHSITNPFQKCSQVRISVQAINEKAPTHRPRWRSLVCPPMFVGSSVFAAAQTTQTNKSREARIRMAFSPFHSATTRFTTFSRLSLGHSFSTTSPVQTKKNLLTPVTLSVETLGTYLLAKVKKIF
jgi:hypothetical protein